MKLESHLKIEISEFTFSSSDVAVEVVLFLRRFGLKVEFRCSDLAPIGEP